VPFLSQAAEIAAKRTGQALLIGEIGCLLSHRAVWRKIAGKSVNEQEHFLILESDSEFINKTVFDQFDLQLLNQYDLFFWGAWDGHMQLFRKHRKQIDHTFQMGTPFIKSIYCTYGYSLNCAAAKFLLKRTKQFSYPVDQYKRFILQQDLKIGGVTPELISTTGAPSNIRNIRKWELPNQLYLLVLDLKNYLICLFK
jgi:GR25 family glycosyltransferase involved in LPS biosynthesis